jgi:hypothetical protein
LIHRWAWTSVFCVVLGVSLAPAAEKNAAYLTALDSIRADDVKFIVDYLADDAREGREAGTRGGYAAGDFVIQRLTQLHLRPAGDPGRFPQVFAPNYRNMLGLLEGSDPKLKDELIVVGAHYDHIGYGSKTTSRGGIGHIHNGADDNASGTSGVLELAHAFTLLPEAPRRSILFVLWDGEEKGLLGSKYWTAHPTLPDRRVAFMLNLDMIGRLRGDRVIVFGSRTSFGMRRLSTAANEGLVLDFPWTMIPNADHYSFFAKNVPVLFLHTGLHDQYHRPEDKANLIDAGGIRRVARFAFTLLYDLANREAGPRFRDLARSENETIRKQMEKSQTALPDRLGATWIGVAPSGTSPGGVRLADVVLNSPAETAGLRTGDRILQFGGRRIATGDDLTGAVFGAGQKAPVVVERPGAVQSLEFTVELSGDPLRVGLIWRVDDAEPGTVVLTNVVPASPAARAGLKAGDRIYQIEGRDFADENEAVRRFKTLSSPIHVSVERDGQIRPMEIRLEAQPVRRAA